MTHSSFNAKSYFISLVMIHGALIFGQMIFAVITLFFQQQNTTPIMQIDTMLIIMIAALAIIAILGGNFIFSSRLRSIKQESDFDRKMANYKIMTIMRYGFLEAPSILSLVFFFLSSDIFFLMISGLLILFLIMVKPSRQRTISELGLSSQEQQRLNFG